MTLVQILIILLNLALNSFLLIQWTWPNVGLLPIKVLITLIKPLNTLFKF